MKNLFYLFLIIPILTIYSCSDFIEKDLANENIEVISPLNGDTSIVMTQVFRWEELKGSSQYQLQIVNPSFTNTNIFIADTLVEGLTYIHTLQPGSYEWRIRGVNSISKTPYITSTLKIDTSSFLQNQTIILQSPANNTFTNQVNVVLAWNSFYSATSYNLQIASPDFSSTSNINFDTTISSTGMALSFLEGQYQWRVRAINSLSSTQFSSTFTFLVDSTSPSTPILLLPNNGTQVSNPFTLYWDNGTESGSTIHDTLYIYNDSLVSIRKRIAIENASSYTDTLTIGNTYFWRVRSFDASGNMSSYSIPKKFIVN